ncbi:MAG: DUF6036 family nucleotidyltransferase [Candidatus Poribacteria bacterium]|nr:DUF6036 family nucleotidyltransferase [Candidatus Poribacteria bacterium]
MSFRDAVNRNRIEGFLNQLGKRFRGAGQVYLVGGTTMVYEGFRTQTLDIDIAFELDPKDHTEFIHVVRELKEEMQINVEEASPRHFIPLPSGYETRCQFLGHYGKIEVFHFDPYSMALSKIERATAEDFSDVLALLKHNWIQIEMLEEAFRDILPRYASESLKGDSLEFKRKFSALKQMWETE